MQNLDQNLRVDNLVTPQESADTSTIHTNSSMWRSMTNYRKGLVVVTAYLASGKTASATLKCGEDKDGSSSANVSASVKHCLLTGESGGTSEVGTIEFDVNDLIGVDEDEHFVGVDIVPSAVGDEVAAVLIRGSARYYKGSAMPV